MGITEASTLQGVATPRPTGTGQSAERLPNRLHVSRDIAWAVCRPARAQKEVRISPAFA
jgi:hypothetical protein